MRPHSNRLKQVALDLRQEQGLGPKKIAARLGISVSTVSRWIYPDYNEKQKQAAREYKERNRGTCQTCGAPTWIGSKTCRGCQAQKLHQDKYWTEERVIEAIQRWASQHGQPPGARDWVRRGDHHPSMSAVYGPHSPFPNWSDAVEAAGFPRPAPGWKKNDKRWDHQQAERLRNLGVSDRQIAKQLGISVGTLRRHLGPRGSREQRPIAANPFRTRQQRIHDLRKAIEQQNA